MNKRKTARTGKQTRRRKRAARPHMKSVQIICVGLAVLTLVFGVSSISIYSKNKDYKQQEAELEAQIKKEEERSEEIKKYQEYVKTDDYIKEVAEDKLGLVDPNEILFKQTK